MDRSGDGQLLGGLASLLFCFCQQRIVEQGGSLVGKRVEHLVVDLAQAAANLAVEIKHAQQAVRLSRRNMLAQRNAVDAANGVGQHACPSTGAVVGERVTEEKFRVAFNRLLHGATRDGGVFFDHAPIRSKAQGQAHLLAFAQENKSTLNAGELKRKVE